MWRALWIILIISILGAGIHCYLDEKGQSKEEQLKLLQIREGARKLKEGGDLPILPKVQDNAPLDDATRESIARMLESQKKHKAEHKQTP